MFSPQTVSARLEHGRSVMVTGRVKYIGRFSPAPSESNPRQYDTAMQGVETTGVGLPPGSTARPTSRSNFLTIRYFEPINWHRTALHELGHAVGAPHRLNRDLSGSYGSKKYAFEELVAEMNAAFCCASLGIVPTVRHADYLGSWLEVLKEDNRAIIRAASQASKAADYILGFLPADDCHVPAATHDTSEAIEAA